MLSLMKRDLLISKAPIVTALFLIPLAYFITIPPIYTSVGILLPVLVIGIFYLDHRANMNRFTKSLPVLNKAIVKSRYLGFLVLWLFLVLYQYLAGEIISALSPSSRYIYELKDIITVIGLGLLMKSLLIPIFYLFKSFSIASTITFVLYTGILFGSFFPLATILGMDDYVVFNDIDKGFVPLIETYIPFQPILVFALVSIILYVLSMKLSEVLFSNKDY